MPSLAKTFIEVANCPDGAMALYNGVLTEKFVHDLKSLGAIITKQDLIKYQLCIFFSFYKPLFINCRI